MCGIIHYRLCIDISLLLAVRVGARHNEIAKYSDASKVLVAKPERQNVPRNLSILMPTHDAATSSARYRNLRNYA
jgi:hypothetical protein